jgi:hypothetical protein
VTWKTFVGLLAGIGAVLVAVAIRHRRVGAESLGSVSGEWIADHQK